MLGTALGLVLTRHGVNTTDDADTYIGVARNLADGHGLTVPFTNVLDTFSPATAVGFHGEVPFLLFGPLLSLVLAPFEWLGIASIDVVRYLNPLLLGLTLAVLGVVAWRVTRRSLLLSLAVVLLSLHTYVLQLYGYVQSEALFLPLALASLLFLGRWAASGRTRYLVAFTAFAALASLARMIGVSLALVGVIAVLLWSADRWSRRVGRAVAVGAGALGPLLVFVLYESALAGAGNRRPLSFRPPGTYDLRPTLDSLTRWLLPSDPYGALSSTHRWVVGALLLAIVLLLAGLAWRAWPRSPGTDDPVAPEPADDVEARRLLGVVAMATVAYLLVLVASRTITDHSAAFQFGGRLLVPALPLGWLLVTGIVAQWATRAWARRVAHTVVVTAGVIGLVLGVAHLSRTGEVLGWDGPGVNPTVGAVAHPRDRRPARGQRRGLRQRAQPDLERNRPARGHRPGPHRRAERRPQPAPGARHRGATRRAPPSRRCRRLPRREPAHHAAPGARGRAGAAGGAARGRAHARRTHLRPRAVNATNGLRPGRCVMIAP